MNLRSLIATISVVTVLLLTSFAFGLPFSHGSSVQAISPPPLSPRISHSASSSTNWAGYAVTSPNQEVTNVNGSWIEPSIVGSCPSTTNQYSSFWVGIDGYSSSTVEQTGTDSDCQNGTPTYYAWYEFYPQPSYLITSLTIRPGDKISADVSYGSTGFTATISDISTGKSFSTDCES